MREGRGDAVSVDHDGTRVDVVVRRSRRARRARLVVHGDGAAELVVPDRARDAQARRLVESNAAWYARHVTRRRAEAAAQPPLPLDRPGHLPLAGAWIAVHADGAGAAGGSTRLVLRDGRLEVAGAVAGPPASRALERWYRAQARSACADHVALEGARLGVRAGAISIRDQRTRWASCARSGALSFSWRLVLAPPAVLRTVVVHELCHLTEPNHGPRFWSLLTAAEPGWREGHAWLARHGRALRAWEPRLERALHAG